MKPYSIDLRERVVSAIEKGDSSYGKVAQRFSVWAKPALKDGWFKNEQQVYLVPRQQGGSVSAVMAHKAKLSSVKVGKVKWEKKA